MIMPARPQPSRPIDAYKAIIDQLVNETRPGGAGFQVTDKGIFSRVPAHRAFNEFIASLSADQRELVSQMLLQERDGAIHDVLAVLSWWIDCRDLGFRLKGEPMPVDLSGMGLHGDYVGRIGGWKWPRESDSPGK
jgi:Family of unknown function (DUF6547)